MKDLVEPRALFRVSKNNCAQFRTIDLAVGIENFLAEFGDDFIVGKLALLQKLVAERIGFEDRTIEIAQNGGHGGFTRCDSAGEADFKHGEKFSRSHGRGGTVREPRRKRAARTVLLMSMAMVSGPTPPGTGVNAPAV